VRHYFRLLWMLLFGRFRPGVSALGPCRTPFRVLPTDLDVLRHVNNGIYLSLMDLGRVDLMRRSGLFASLARKGWYPVVIAETIQFRRSLTLWQRFTIVTRVLGWDERAIVVEQRFERGGETIARAWVRARFLRREGGSVPTADLLALAGIAFEDAPVMPARAERWNADNLSWPTEGEEPVGLADGA
jgi:acyl-CoA thioesterase FadM